MRQHGPDEADYLQPLRTLDLPGLRLCEGMYEPTREIPAHPHEWATLTLTVAGGYLVDWFPARLRCGPASFVFHPPGDVYSARISDLGSRCLTIRIDPRMIERASEEAPGLAELECTRRALPHRLAFELRRELEREDERAAAEVEDTVIALLVELGDRPGLDAPSASPPWLERVRERIDDEFRRHLSLQTLALTANVHRVHLAREFRRRFGCTVGQYIRQRRVELACHRLMASDMPLSSIAFEAGFADQSHFTNTFRRLVGSTPGAFRARYGTSPGG